MGGILVVVVLAGAYAALGTVDSLSGRYQVV
jgi:hypothetical protein